MKIYCDAGTAIADAGVIMKTADNGVDRPLAFKSRKLRVAEGNYSATELE